MKEPIAPLRIHSPVRGLEQPARHELHAHSSGQCGESLRRWVQAGRCKRPTEVRSNLEIGGVPRTSRSHFVFNLGQFVSIGLSATIAFASIPNVKPASRNVRWSIPASGFYTNGCRTTRGFASLRSGNLTHDPRTDVEPVAFRMDWAVVYAAHRRSAIRPTTQ